jgi:hypothetical protein
MKEISAGGRVVLCLKSSESEWRPKPLPFPLDGPESEAGFGRAGELEVISSAVRNRPIQLGP